MATRLTTLALGCLLAFHLIACGGPDDEPPPPTTPTQVRILAAHSLRGLLDHLKVAYEAEHPRQRLDIRFGNAPRLVSDVLRGDHADLIIVPATPSIEALELSSDAMGEWMLDPMVAVRPEGSTVTLRQVADGGGLVAVHNDTMAVGADTRVALRVAELYEQLKMRTLQCLSTERVLERVADGTAVMGIVYAGDASASEQPVEVAERLQLPERLERRYVTGALSPEGESVTRWLLQDISVGLAAENYGLLPLTEGGRVQSIPE